MAGLSGCGRSPVANGGSAASALEGSVQTSGRCARAATSSFRNADLGCDLRHTGTLELAYARNFTVDEYEGGYRLVCISNGERFLVIPEGASVPEGLAADIATIRQPARTYLVSTGMICLLDEIDALDEVSVSSVTAEDSPSERLSQAIEDGAVSYGGKYSAPDFELIAQTGCTLAIENTKINHAPDIKQKLQDLGVTVLTEQSSSEPEVLGRLEWIKLMGVVFGREDEANEAFARIAQRVEDTAAQAPTGKTVAFFYINDDGAAVTRRSTDYVSQMIELAGGTFLSFDPTDDVVIYNTTVDSSVASIDDLIGKNPLLADFKAVQKGNVFACDEDMYQAMTSMDGIIGDMRSALTGADGNASYIWKLE